ncbi:MAG: prepilin-type N-terminal cleavage/methylation domain-containing protein [Armatimonadetes bacterium]|nr:prepilin-type N-terminal cleavage/methylation domain-containing protein [Armatimonadota bacterium]
MRNLRSAGARRGFTLVELLVGLIVGLLVLTGVHRIFIAGIKTQNTTSLQTEVNRKAQVAIDSMVSKLRGSSEIRQSLPGRIWFIDQDGEDISYWVSNGTLYQDGADYSGGVPLASNVSQMQFVYLDRDGQPTASADAVYSVRVLLHVERSSHVAELRSAVRLRNK